MTENNTQVGAFNPTKQELILMVEGYKVLAEAKIQDMQGFGLADEARKKLKKTRRAIELFGKDERQKFIDAQKKVIRQERELTELIDPIEKALADRQEEYRKEQELITRRDWLPERKQRLASIQFLTVSDNELMEMDDNTFNAFFLQKKEDYLNKLEQERQEKIRKDSEEREERERKERLAQEEKNRVLREANEKAEREKIEAAEALRKAEDDKARLVREAEQAKIKAELDAKKAEEDKLKAVEAERTRLEKEKADEEKRKELEAERIAEAERLKKENEEKEQKLREKRSNYHSWLQQFGCTEDNMSDFHIIKDETKIILYKKLGEFFYNI